MVRRTIAGIGRTLIAIGVLMLLFVAYQLEGTGIATAREQKRLTKQATAQFEAAGINLAAFDAIGNDPTATLPTESLSLGTPPTTISPSVSRSAPPAVVADTVPEAPDITAPPSATVPIATTVPRVPVAPTTTEFVSRRPMQKVPRGKALGLIRIPRINLRYTVIEGTSVDDLKSGPGHYESTPLPGEPGNAAIAGHRTTYGKPFYRLDELQKGDSIFVATGLGVFRYQVIDMQVVSPKNTTVLDEIPGRNTLTLTTCHPKFSAAKRLIVTSELTGPAVEADLIEPATTTTLAPVTTPPVTTAPAIRPVNPGDDDPVVASTIAFPDSAPGAAASDTTVAAVAPDATVSSTPSTTVAVAPDATGAAIDGPALDSRSIGKRYTLGWFSGKASIWRDTLFWAGLGAVIWFGAWLIAHRKAKIRTRVGVYFLGLLPFLVVLFLCYENLALLLPENV